MKFPGSWQSKVRQWEHEPRDKTSKQNVKDGRKPKLPLLTRLDWDCVTSGWKIRPAGDMCLNHRA